MRVIQRHFLTKKYSSICIDITLQRVLPNTKCNFLKFLQKLIFLIVKGLFMPLWCYFIYCFIPLYPVYVLFLPHCIIIILSLDICLHVRDPSLSLSHYISTLVFFLPNHCDLSTPNVKDFLLGIFNRALFPFYCNKLNFWIIFNLKGV